MRMVGRELFDLDSDGAWLGVVDGDCPDVALNLGREQGEFIK